MIKKTCNQLDLFEELLQSQALQYRYAKNWLSIIRNIRFVISCSMAVEHNKSKKHLEEWISDRVTDLQEAELRTTMIFYLSVRDLDKFYKKSFSDVKEMIKSPTSYGASQVLTFEDFNEMRRSMAKSMSIQLDNAVRDTAQTLSIDDFLNIKKQVKEIKKLIK